MKRLIILLTWAGAFPMLFAQDFSPVIHRMVPNLVDIRSMGMGKTGSAGNTVVINFCNPHCWLTTEWKYKVGI